MWARLERQDSAHHKRFSSKDALFDFTAKMPLEIGGNTEWVVGYLDLEANLDFIIFPVHGSYHIPKVEPM